METKQFIGSHVKVILVRNLFEHAGQCSSIVADAGQCSSIVADVHEALKVIGSI